MTKKLMAAMTALIMCAVLAGCGETSETDDTDTTTTTTTAAAENDADETGDDVSEAADEEKPEDEGDPEEEPQEDPEGSEGGDSAAEEVPEGAEVYSNDIYSVELDSEKWLSMNEYKELIAQVAADNVDQYDTIDYSALMGGVYYYAGNSGEDYPTNIIFANPTYDPTMADYSIGELSDLLIQSMELQMSTIEGMEVVSGEMVKHSGEEMLLIQTHYDDGDVVYDCDEYVFLKEGTLCVLSVNYASEDDGKKDFDNMLDNLKF